MGRTAILYIAEKCNQDCVFCLEMDGSWKEFVDPSTQQVHDHVARLYEEGARHITFMGGETFFRKDLPQILKRAKEVGYTRVGVTTNGTVLSKHGFIRKLADSGLDFIEMSIHAHTPELANIITRNTVTFERQASALAEISEVKLFTIVNVVICRENKDHLIDVSRYVLENHRDIPVRFKFKFVSLQGLAMEEDGESKEASALHYDEVDFEALGDYLEDKGTPFWFYNVPLCRLGRHARHSHELATLSVDETYFDYDHRAVDGYYDSGNQLEGRVWPERSCAPCTLRPLCPGMEESHRRVAGEGVLTTRSDDPIPAMQFALADRGLDPALATARLSVVSKFPRPSRFIRPGNNNSAIRFKHPDVAESLDVMVEPRQEGKRSFFATERFTMSYLNWSSGDAGADPRVRELLDAAAAALIRADDSHADMGGVRAALAASAPEGWEAEVPTAIVAPAPAPRKGLGRLPILDASAHS